MSKDDELRRDVQRLKESVFGNGKLGLSQQVLILWKWHIYLLCLCATAVGSILTILVHRLVKYLSP